MGAGLYGIGIPKDSIVKYENALKFDKFIVVAHGTAAEEANFVLLRGNFHAAILSKLA